MIDLRDEARYLPTEAAAYLGLPVSTVRAWTAGQGRTRPVIRPAQARPLTLSFWNLVEVYVLASIRRQHRVSLQRTRQAVRYVQRERHLERPLIEQDFYTDGVDLFVEELARLLQVSGAPQSTLKELLVGSLARIDRDPDGLPLRMSPWQTSPIEPRVVEIDPMRAFGRLVLAGTSIPMETLAERFRAGDNIAHLAADYRLGADQVEAALRWEQRALAA